MTTLIEQLRAKLDAYNMVLAIIDSSQSEIEELEKTLSTVSERILIGVALRYGTDSREYEMAGGMRKSERIRRSTVSRLKAGAEEVPDNAILNSGGLPPQRVRQAWSPTHVEGQPRSYPHGKQAKAVRGIGAAVIAAQCRVERQVVIERSRPFDYRPHVCVSS